MTNQPYACAPAGWQHRDLYHTAPVNITESEDMYMIHLYAPDLQKENISITTQQDILTIRYQGEREATATYTRREYRTEEINRSFDLKGKIVIDGIKASYTDGILRIELPKTDAARRAAQNVAID